MATLNKQLEKSVELAHLTLTGEEKSELSKDLEKILNFVEIVKKNTGNSENKEKEKNPSEINYPQLKKRNVWRDDTIQPFEKKEELLAVVPAKKDSLIKVKKI